MLDTLVDESYNYWRDIGAPKIPACSLLGNEQGEGQFVTHPVGDSGQALGLAQWHLARRQQIKAGCGIDVGTASHADQLRAMHWELLHMGLWAPLIACKTTLAGCTLLVQRYEMPMNRQQQIRLRTGFANLWMKEYDS